MMAVPYRLDRVEPLMGAMLSQTYLAQWHNVPNREWDEQRSLGGQAVVCSKETYKVPYRGF